MLLLSISYILLYLFGLALASFDPSAKNNLAVYWGQNSANSATSQTRLSDYCHGTNVNIILLSFLTTLNGQGGQPVLNFANQGEHCDKTMQPMKCREIEDDINFCQSRGKTILLSLGGDGSAEVGYADDTAARMGAAKIWQMFGPDQKKPDVVRPFGSAVVNGFDFDFESASKVQNAVAFMGGLREHMRTASEGAPFYLSAAPICSQAATGGHSSMESILDQLHLDMVFVQFYNDKNCDVRNGFNFDKWNEWAKWKNTAIFVGLPASETAAPSGGYLAPNQLKEKIWQAKGREKMAGAMLWDASQAWTNDYYHLKVKAALNESSLRVRHWDARPMDRAD